MPKLITLVHMGDSITFGQHIDPTLRWTSLVYNQLEAKFCDTDTHVQSMNHGISGETTRMGLERYPRDVQTPRPHVMTLQFGLNDCNCWLSDRGAPRVSPEAYRANLIEMIDRARRFHCEEIILSTNHTTLRTRKMLSGETYEAANARYSEILRSVAKMTGVVLCDIRPVFEKFSQTELAELLLPYPDQLHLSIAGNRIYADAIYPFVETALTKVLHSASTQVGTTQDNTRFKIVG